MAISPSPLTPPDGSIAQDTSYSISDINLDILDPVAQSQLLAVSNLGTTTTSKINSSLDLIRTYENLEVFTLDHTHLDGLHNNTASASYAVTNTGSSDFVRVIIILGEFHPSGTPKVRIVNNSNYYEMTISDTLSKKRIEFNSIPASFVTSFWVENHTNTKWPDYGNSILVVNL